MKTYATFINSSFAGYRTMKEIQYYLGESRKEAIHRRNNADHVIYGYYSYLNDEINTAHIQILEKTDKEFDTIASLPNYRIFAFHKFA